VNPAFAKTIVKSLVDHYAAIIETLLEPPILIGHSFGGLIVQLLLDRGLGSRGIAIDPGNPRGVIPSLAAIIAAAPVLSWSEQPRQFFCARFRGRAMHEMCAPPYFGVPFYRMRTS